MYYGAVTVLHDFFVTLFIRMVEQVLGHQNLEIVWGYINVTKTIKAYPKYKTTSVQQYYECTYRYLKRNRLLISSCRVCRQFFIHYAIKVTLKKNSVLLMGGYVVKGFKVLFGVNVGLL